MAQHWASKTPSEVVERYWNPTLADGDSVDSFTALVTGATLDSSELTEDGVRLVISAGTLDATATAELTVTTSRGLVLAETFYLPIRSSDNAFAQTVGDVVAYALRPVVGVGETATASEQDDAIEVLGDMMAEWAASGAQVGMRLPPVASDVIYSLDSHISAIKSNLRVRVCDFYGVPVTASDARAAQRGIQRVKAAMLPDSREGVDYY